MTAKGSAAAVVLVLVSALFWSEVPRGLAQTRNDKVNQPESRYEDVLAAIEAKRASLAKRFVAGSNEEKEQVLREAGDYLVDALSKQLFPLWYGTPWDFNGAARRPGEGSIACGMFVGRVLAHVGFSIPSVTRLAQQPSELIIKNLIPSNEIRRYSSVEIEKVETAVRKWGKGVYLVGLDIHVGFVVNDGDSIRFVHSSYYNPPLAVVAEPLTGHNPLADSQYRVLGRLTNPTTLRKWLQGESFPLKYDYFRKRRARH